jgi:hypothetical protein
MQHTAGRARISGTLRNQGFGQEVIKIACFHAEIFALKLLESVGWARS